MTFRISVFSLTLLCLFTSLAWTQTREEKVRNDRKKVEAENFWIYNDLAKGLAEAKSTGKPMIVILRCIPCEECVKLDDELVNDNPKVRPLLEKFVRVRIISTNGLDLSLFQFDTDQSFAGFFMNADKVIYGRYGTRSHRTYWSDDVSVEGLAKALEGALELHRNYPKNKTELAGKIGAPPEFATPEQMPTLKGKYTAKLDEAGKIVPSCIHCHQIGDTLRTIARVQPKPLPEKLLFPYPHPKTLGLILDPRERATVTEVTPDSWASKAGFAKGDVIRKLAGQTPLSIADLQWILHQTDGNGATLTAAVQRGDQMLDLALKLPKGWKQSENISWRTSSWGLRRMATGGMFLETLNEAERKQAGIDEGTMALRAKHVGQFGPHAAAQKAGFRVGDIIIDYDGQTSLQRETDLFAYAMQQKRVGEEVTVRIRRGNQALTLKLPMQP